VVRFIFTTGMHAVSYLQDLERQAAEAASVAGGSRENLVDAVRRLAQRAEDAERKARRYMELYASILTETLRGEPAGRYKLAVVELDDEELAKRLAQGATSRDKDLVLIVAGGERVSIYTGGVDVAPIVKALREIGFRGGGSKTFAQGQYKGDLQTLKEAVKKALS
jgi:alanyl-tRNA synthetase